MTTNATSNAYIAEPDSVGLLIDRAERLWPEREYLSFEGRRYTYEAFNRWVRACAAVLVARGVGGGDRVLVQLPNRPEALVMQVAAFRIGAVNVPVVPIYREHELRHIIEDSRPAAVVASGRLGSRRPCEEIDSICAELGHHPAVRFAVEEAPQGWQMVPDYAESDPGTLFADPADPEDPALVLYTSGTTSLPKGAVISSAAVIAQIRAWVSRTRITMDDVVLVGSPMSHLAGFFMGIVMPAYVGARVVAMRAWNPAEAACLIAAEGATVAAGASVFLRDLVDIWSTGRYADRRLRLYLSSGSATAPELIRSADDLGVTACRTYGMTECGVCTGAEPDDSLELRSTRDGRVLDGVEIEAVSATRVKLPAGQEGELRVRSAQRMSGHTDAAASAQQIDEGGWFYTGDLGSVSDTGWVTMTGRLKEIINRGGEKFSTQDIEFAISRYPDVRDVAVVGIPDERLGERVGAFVVLHEDAIWDGPEQILEHLERLRLAKAKMPVEWTVLPELPRNPTGKVQKFKLLASAESNAANL